MPVLPVLLESVLPVLPLPEEPVLLESVLPVLELPELACAMACVLTAVTATTERRATARISFFMVRSFFSWDSG